MKYEYFRYICFFIMTAYSLFAHPEHPDEIIWEPQKNFSVPYLREIVHTHGYSTLYKHLTQELVAADENQLTHLLKQHNLALFPHKKSAHSVISHSQKSSFQKFIQVFLERVEVLLLKDSVRLSFLYELPSLCQKLRVQPGKSVIGLWEKRIFKEGKIEKILESTGQWIDVSIHFSKDFSAEILERAHIFLQNLSIEGLYYLLYFYNWLHETPSAELLNCLNKHAQLKHSNLLRNALAYMHLWENIPADRYAALHETVEKSFQIVQKEDTTISQFQWDVAEDLIKKEEKILVEPYIPCIGRKVDLLTGNNAIYEVDGPTHFVYKITPQGVQLIYDGSTTLSTDLMLKKGFVVCRISFDDARKKRAIVL